MTKLVADVLDVLALRDQCAGIEVPETVEPNAPDLGLA
jgi:hypothetical protein